MSQIAVLQKLLEVRTKLVEIKSDLEDFYSSDFERLFPEVGRMQKLERKIFKKVDDWSKD